VTEPRHLAERDEISLYELLGIAMREGLDLRKVVVSYAGCGSHNVLVTSPEEAYQAPRKLGPLAEGELTPAPRKLVPEEDAYDDALPAYGWETRDDFGVFYQPGESELTISVVRDGHVDEEAD
jgi:hypothetical protein